jgi:predicted deacetylase
LDDAVDENLTAIRLEHARENLDKRGFARSVFAQQTHDLSGIEREAHIAQGLEAAKTTSNAEQFDDRRRLVTIIH